ncbi:MAG: YebC/PmpR family DNA-binding transcriptional regulator [bacterium]
MSGHSKWSSIKHKKAAVDAKRGKIFTRIIREMTMAARQGGGDPSGNARLRKAIDDAKAANMPQDNIKRAIKKGTGELPGTAYEECLFEGYGPGGVAVLVDAVTDNKNRTTAELRMVFSRRGGNLGEAGCVGWMFTKKGLINISKKKIGEEDLLNTALEAGAEDVNSEDEDLYEILCDPKDFENVKSALEKLGLEVAELTMLPQTYIKLEGKNAEQMLELMESLEDHDDVQNAYANFDISKEIMEKMSRQ